MNYIDEAHYEDDGSLVMVGKRSSGDAPSFPKNHKYSGKYCLVDCGENDK